MEEDMPKIIEARLIAEGKKFAIVASRFNDFITDRLVSGAVDALQRSGAKESDIEIVKVPGCLMPLSALGLLSAEQHRTLIM
jgi:6,7-dimethyl-8-ribityllumazine synthase